MIHYNFPLKSYNTFGLDVIAERFIEYNTTEELLQYLQEIYPATSCLHIGGGSNLLFTQPYFKGTILHSAIKGMDIVSEDNQFIYIRVGAGEVWDDFVKYAVLNGWGGVENLSHIPGEVGASAIQNVGAYGVEAKDIIEKVYTVEVATGSFRVFHVDECEYGYRQSIFKKEYKNHYIITHVEYRLFKEPVFNLSYGNISAVFCDREATLMAIREHIIKIREEKLPDSAVWGNAGSYFMNPVVDKMQMDTISFKYPEAPYYKIDETHYKIPAAWLIEKTGWKGKSLSNATVYEKQPLVIINRGGATAKDIMGLADAVINSVEKEFHIRLHPEVIYV